MTPSCDAAAPVPSDVANSTQESTRTKEAILRLALNTVLATATTVQAKLADAGDVVLAAIVGQVDAGACCIDEQKVCQCVICPGSPVTYDVYAYDCNCNCIESSHACIPNCTVGA